MKAFQNLLLSLFARLMDTHRILSHKRCVNASFPVPADLKSAVKKRFDL